MGWKDIYYDIMFSDTININDIGRAQDIKFSNLPEKFYKYREVNDYSIDNLINDTVWLNLPSDFSDPYDSALMFNTKKSLEYNLLNEEGFISKESLSRLNNHGIGEDQLKSIIKKSGGDLKEFYKLLVVEHGMIKDEVEAKAFAHSLVDGINNYIDECDKNYINRIRSKFLITCFSEVNDSILMWSHYANSHKGFCIEYDFKLLGSQDVRVRLLRPVYYKQKMFDMTKIIKLMSQDKGFNNLALYSAATIKSPEWSYEKEWRMILESDILKTRCYRVPKPTALYLGSKISDVDRENLIAIAQRKNIKVYNMDIKQDEFKLVAKEILT